MSNPRARTWVVIAAAAVVVAAIVSMSLYANRFQYDEQAHQNVIAAYGVTVTDWDAYRDSTRKACEFDDDTFELYVLMDEDLNRLQLDIQYACPDRMDEFSDITGMPPLD